MNLSATTAKALALALTWIVLGLAPVRAQLPTSEERLKILTNPEDVKKKAEKDKEKIRPPIEMSLSQIAPFDVLPYVKPNHWSTITLELRANYEDYVGSLQTSPVPLIGLPQEIVYRRDARLAKAQRMRLGLQMLLPEVPAPPHAEITMELARTDAIRADEAWTAPVHALEPHQMLVVVLTKESNGPYATWNRFNALIPQSVDPFDATSLEKLRYYRLVLPLTPEKPPLSSHPLTWTTTSHVIWDGLPPDTLNPSQQQALLDWIHWGGQLTLIGGAGPAFSILNDSFLAPYLPAEITGETALLTREDLTPLSRAYPPLTAPKPIDQDKPDVEYNAASESNYRGYRRPVAINPPPNRPVFLVGMRPRPGAEGIAMGDSGDRLVGVEWRVGRGRVLMLALSPIDPALAVWPGLDTFVRRVILRRPEEVRFSAPRNERGRIVPPKPEILRGPELSWVRYLSRDTERPSDPTVIPVAEPAMPAVPVHSNPIVSPTDAEPAEDEELAAMIPKENVAGWVDRSFLPQLGRDLLEEASGIKIPSALFVLKVVLAYIITLVPLNWLICRYVLGRRELAWVVVPVLSLGFAIGVERAAAYDMGYNSACDEIVIVEAFGDYPRAHVSRFSSLYSTGRTRFNVSFPDDPTALALPLDTGRTIRGESVSTAIWQSYPVPALEGFLVQPRSLAMVRAEQMLTLDGAVSMVSEGAVRKVVNHGSLELRDAVVVDVSGPKNRRETYLGTIAPGATVTIAEAPRLTADPATSGALRPQRFLRVLRQSHEDRPENQGEIRLVAWSPRPLAGQKVEPAVDRHRGFTAVVVHLRQGPPPSPDGPVYNRAPQPAN